MSRLPQHDHAGVTPDIPARSGPWRQLREHEAILESLVDGVFVVDLDARFTVANWYGAVMHGLRPHEVLGRSIYDFPNVLRMRHFDGRPLQDDEHPLKRALAGEVVRDFEKRIFNKETGRDVYFRINASPVRDLDGDLIGAVEIARDVTALCELDVLKDEFVRVAAHELKTPIAVIRGYVGALLRTGSELPATPRQMLEAIARGAMRMTSLVQDLLDMSRLHLGRMSLVIERVALAEVVDSVVSSAALGAHRHDIRVKPLQPVSVRADGPRLKQTLALLLDNAIRYSPDDSEIFIDLELTGDQAILTVHDHGIGIPRDRQPHIFERFYRAHTDTPFDAGGMGASLFIGRSLMRQMGGDLWFEAEERQGSRFHLSVPLWGPG